MTNTYRTAAGLYITNRPAAFADGVQPVNIMVSAFVQMYFIGAELLILQIIRPSLNMPAIDLHLALGSGEQNSVGGITGHCNTARILISKHLVIFAVGRDNFNRAALVHTHTPLGDIKVMRPPVGHPAAAKAAVVAPVRKAVPAQMR